MALLWTGQQHDTPSLADASRDDNRIAHAGQVAYEGVRTGSFEKLCEGVRLSHQLQVEDEGMERLPGDEGCVDPKIRFQESSKPLAWKYCGGGGDMRSIYLNQARIEMTFVQLIQRTW